MYKPAEDSELMAEFLPIIIQKERPARFLDMGCGSGIQSRVAIKAGIKKESILAVDIDSDALKETGKLGVQTRKSDLFENIKEKFDLIALNPPYLPEHEREKGRDTTGGKHGWEAIERFLHKAKGHLTENGKILLLFSSLTNKEKVESLIQENGFSFRLLAVQKHFQEELYLVLLEKY